MSRIGRMPIIIPKGVEVEIKGSYVRVTGPKGELNRTLSPTMVVELEDGKLLVKRPNDERMNRSLHGMTRSLVNNMVTGVSTGFEKVLEINGVGYRAEVDPKKNLILYMGYSHPVTMEPPAGINFEVDQKTRQIKVLGFDKELVGQVAANIRMVRPPEPYHGKGIKYLDEKIRRKAGKAGKA